MEEAILAIHADVDAFTEAPLMVARFRTKKLTSGLAVYRGEELKPE
jgi:hypothetical protein